MASSSRERYAGIHQDYGEKYAVVINQDYWEDPRGVPTAAPSRSVFTFPSLHVIDEELAIEFLGTVCVSFTVFGFVFLAVGVFTIVLPIVFVSISVQQVVAWMLVIGGLVSFLHFGLNFGNPGTTSFFLLGVLHLTVGLWLLIQASMRRGMAFVWIILGWFLVHGVIKLVMGYEIRSMKAWPAIVVSGGAAIVLGFLNIALVPKFGLVVLGFLFGVDFAVTALAFLLISMVAYQVASQLSTRIDPLLEQY